MISALADCSYEQAVRNLRPFAPRIAARCTLFFKEFWEKFEGFENSAPERNCFCNLVEGTFFAISGKSQVSGRDRQSAIQSHDAGRLCSLTP
jgi:hypothetical protein